MTVSKIGSNLESIMNNNRVVSEEKCLEARKAHLAKDETYWG